MCFAVKNKFVPRYETKETPDGITGLGRTDSTKGGVLERLGCTPQFCTAKFKAEAAA
jgi:hypothetical protein